MKVTGTIRDAAISSLASANLTWRRLFGNSEQLNVGPGGCGFSSPRLSSTCVRSSAHIPQEVL